MLPQTDIVLYSDRDAAMLAHSWHPLAENPIVGSLMEQSLSAWDDVQEAEDVATPRSLSPQSSTEDAFAQHVLPEFVLPPMPTRLPGQRRLTAPTCLNPDEWEMT